MKLTRFLAPVLGFLALICSGIAAAGNNSWTVTGPPSGSVYTIATHPTNSQIAIASTIRGIVRSTDSGESWTLLASETSNVVQQILFDPTASNRVVAIDGAIYLSEDTGQTFLPAQGPEVFGNVSRVAFASNGTLYAVMYSGRAFKATPPFSTWTELAHPWPATAYARAITVDPANPLNVYVAADGVGIYRSIDGGMNWTGPLSSGFLDVATAAVYQLRVSPGNPARVFAATSSGLQRSTNNGSTWSVVENNPTSWIEFDPNSPDTIIATRGISQLSRSTDGGDTFTGLVSELRVNGLPEGHFVAGSSTRILYATERGIALGTFQTGGTHLYTYRATGIGGGYTWRVVMADDGLVFVSQPSGFHDIFLRRNPDVVPYYLESDGTFGLTSVTTGVKQVTSLAVAPTNSNILFAVNGTNQLVRSFNRGSTFTTPHTAFTLGSAGDYINDVQIATDPQVAYVARAETGVWKTLNGGATFARLTSSPTYVGAVAIHPANNSVLYAAGGACNASGIYKSTNGGASWSQQVAPVDCSGPYRAYNGFFFDPVQTNTVYATAWGGVLKTVDGGAHWALMNFSPLTGTDAAASAMLIDPLIPSTMILVNASSNPGFLRSVDGGVTWAETIFEIPGRETILNHAVMPMPGQIVAGSIGAGVVEYTVAPDLSLEMTPTPAVLPLGTNYQATLTVTNLGPHASSASEITLFRPTWLTPTVPANCTAAGQTLTCRIGVLQVGQSAQLPLTFAVAGLVNGNQLTVYVSGHEADPNSGNNRVDRVVTAAELIDLDLTLTATPAVFDVGGVTEFVAEFINRGPGPATNVRLDFLGALGSFVAEQITPSQGTCQMIGTPSCSFGTVPANTTVRVTYRLRGDFPGDFDITGILSATGPDSDNDQNRVDSTIRVRPVSDLAVSLSKSADPVNVDAPLRYVATVRNNGPGGSPAEGPSRLEVAVTGATVNSATPSEGSCSNTATTVTCTFNPANVATVTINLGTAAPGFANATATVTYPGTDTDLSNNTASIGTTIRRTGDVSVEITDTADPVNLGQDFAYLVTLRNSGPNAGSVDLDIPVTSATISGVASSSATCTHAATSAHCTLAMLAPGSAASITVNIAGAQAPGIATATATAIFAGVDTDSSNNSASAGTTLRRTGDVSVEIADSADPVTVDAPFSYTVTLRNAGPNAGPVQVVIPVLNATVTDATSSAATCSHSATSATCDVTSLASGGTAVLNVNVSSSTPGAASATATATYAGLDTNNADNTATASTTVRLVGDVSVTVTDSVDPATTGVAYSYAVTVRNGGPNAGAVNISVPVTGATVASATMTGATCTNTASQVTCDIASLASNASAVLTINVSSATAGAASAAATVAFTGTDPDAANNTAMASTVVSAPPPPPPPPPTTPPRPGGGGGGRFDWLALALLGGLLAHNRWRIRAARA